MEGHDLCIFVLACECKLSHINAAVLVIITVSVYYVPRLCAVLEESQSSFNGLSRSVIAIFLVRIHKLLTNIIMTGSLS